jgi:hypothetical protein
MLAIVFGFSTLPVFLLTAVVYIQSSIQWVSSSVRKLLQHEPDQLCQGLCSVA